jgi:hypothetical protein
VNAHDATLTGLATAHTSNKVHNHTPGAPAGSGFHLILAAAADSVLGQPRRARHADHQRDRPDHGQPAVAAADPAPGFRYGQPLKTQRHRPG